MLFQNRAVDLVPGIRLRRRAHPKSTATSTVSPESDRDPLEQYPWLSSVRRLSPAYPVIEGFIHKLTKDNAIAKKIVLEYYKDRADKRRESHRRTQGPQQYQAEEADAFHPSPSRCVLLIFRENRVDQEHFHSAESLRKRIERAPNDGTECRLWILEDLEPAWLEVLGSLLKIDPLVPGEQMNTFHWTDSKTNQTRLSPSMVKPARWFSLRYFEFRHLLEPKLITANTNQMTFAMNMRRIERWRDIDTPVFRQIWRHSLTRRAVSFWTNQPPQQKLAAEEEQDLPPPSWDSVIFVDPAFHSFPRDKKLKNVNQSGGLIFRSPKKYDKIDEQWKGRVWDEEGSVEAEVDISVPFHGGSQTLADDTLDPMSDPGTTSALSPTRDFGSLLDEIVLHWTQLATQEEISAARAQAVNASLFLFRYTADLWTRHLDIIQATIAQSEFFSDDHQLNVNNATSSQQWRAILNQMTRATLNMNALRRYMSHFDAHMTLNLERLGAESCLVDPSAPVALQAAQRDFIHIYRRLNHFNTRASALSRTANELANLQASFKGVQDGELGVTLSILASVVFPATLIASIFSMGGDYLPGGEKFWVYWTTAVPVTVALMGVMLSRRYVWQRIGPMFTKEEEEDPDA